VNVSRVWNKVPVPKGSAIIFGDRSIHNFLKLTTWTIREQLMSQNVAGSILLFGGVGSVEERRSLAGGLSLSCARPAADG